MTSIDEKLDQYIDAINAGRRPPIDRNDQELYDLCRVVDQLQVLREPAWPPESFAAEMARQLSTALAIKSNGRMNHTGMVGDAEAVPSNPWVQRDEDVRRLEAFPPPTNRFRHALQVAATLAAFSIFALVLVLVFGDVRGDGFNAPSAALPANGVHQIAFSADYSGGLDVYVVNSDGTDLTRLTDDPGNDTFPVWSPDGSRIAFVSDRSGIDHVYVMDADGSNLRQITGGPFGTGRPQWSPDGTQLAALRLEGLTQDNSMAELVVMNSDGSGIKSLTDGTVPAGLFAWSPSGDEIAVSMGLFGRGPQIMVFDVNGDGYRGLRATETFQYEPRWSPDGSRIAFAEGEQTANTADTWVAIVDITGENYEVLDETRGFAYSYAWSPDGGSIALAGTDAEGQSGIILAPVGSQEPRQLLHGTGPEDVIVGWSPDAAYLAIVRQTLEPDGATRSDLLVVAAGGEPVTMAQSIAGYSPPSWRPTGTALPEIDDTNIEEPTVTPDSGLTPVPQPVVRATPPSLQIQFADGDFEAMLGSYSWVDDEEGAVASATSPFIDVGKDGPAVAPGSELRVGLPDEASRPGSIVVSLYTWPENSATPENAEENVADRSWFVPTTDPVRQYTLIVDDPRFTVPDSTGHYVAQVEAHWPDFDKAPGEISIPMFATYATNIYVVAEETRSEEASEQTAIAIVRHFLDDPDAVLQARHNEGDGYEVIQPVDGSDEANVFHVDIALGHVVFASFSGHSTLHVPANPVTEEEALQIAEQHARQWAPGFNGMKLWTTDTGVFGRGVNVGDALYTASWSLQDDETGAWMPPRATVTVNMETGLVHGFFQSLETIDYSTIPTISAEQAGRIVLEHLDSEQGENEELYEVASVELIASEESSVPIFTLVWQVEINAGEGLYFVDAHTGDVTFFDMPPSGPNRGAEEPASVDREPNETISKGDVIDILSAFIGDDNLEVVLELREQFQGQWIYEVSRTAHGIQGLDRFVVNAQW